jgi:plastocyanin
MKRAGIAVAAVITAVLLGGGVWWFLTNKATAPSAPTATPDTSSTTETPSSNSDVLSGTVNIDMKNTAFSMATIKIKKGTKVVWTNQDSIRHNVVADDSNGNNLPTSNDTIGKGQTYTFTFNAIGVVKYHCTPHPFMSGMIEVVE